MEKKLNYFTSLRFLYKYIRKYRSNFIMFYFGWLFDLVLSIVMPILFGIMIDEIVYYQNLNTFLSISIAYVIMSVFSCVLYFFIYAQHHYIMSMYTFDIKMDIFDHMQKCDAKYMGNLNSGDVITSILAYAEECMHFVIRNVIHNINHIIGIVVALIYLYRIYWQIGVFISITVPLCVFVNTKFGEKTRSYGEEKRTYYDKYISWLYEILSSFRDIRLLGSKIKVNKEFVSIHRKMFRVNVKFGLLTLVAENIVAFVNLMTQLGIFTFAGIMALKGDLTIGVLTIIIAFFTYLTKEAQALSTAYLDAQNRISYIQKIYDFLHLPVEKDEGKDILKVTKGDIHFHDASFSYKDNGKDYVIKDLNLDIKSKERFALIGKSGCGKTTIGLMLIGFYVPQHGYIEIDGQRLDKCSLKTIRQSIGLIQQDVLLFDGTIKDNLLLGNRNAASEEIQAACEQAGIWEFLCSLEQGISTVVGTKGISLSGGQRQRIAIARIYLRNPPIIIFDEATSAIDPETEEQIHSEWKRVLAGRTTIMIAHRESSVLLCDRAAMLDGGQIVLTGTPNELANNNEKFQKLFAIKKEACENA